MTHGMDWQAKFVDYTENRKGSMQIGSKVQTTPEPRSLNKLLV